MGTFVDQTEDAIHEAHSSAELGRSIQSLVALLLALNPAAAFNPSGRVAGRVAGLAVSKCASQRVLDPRCAVDSPPWLRNLFQPAASAVSGMLAQLQAGGAGRRDKLPPGNAKPDVLGAMSASEKEQFFTELFDTLEARGHGEELARFAEFCKRANGRPAPVPIFETGQTVQSNKYFPGLTAKPSWDRPLDVEEENDPFPWLRRLEAYVPAIAAELRAVRDAELPEGYCLDDGNREFMQTLPGLTETERSIYVQAFDEQPENGYCQTVLMANEDRKKVADLFPQTMAALEACGVRTGVRLVAFGKQLPHSALHWHSDGRNFMLTCHLPLAGPSKRTGDRTPPFGRRDPDTPPDDKREGATGMILAPMSFTDEGMSLNERVVSRSWQPGRGVVFDTTFLHSAYNDGDEAADILFIDFFHPELSDAEVDAIKCLQQMLRDKGEASTASYQAAR